MFFANSLNDKIKRSLSQFELDPTQKTCLFPYSKKPNSPNLLVIHKKIDDNGDLELMSLNTRQKKFTVSKLKTKWNEKLNINFEPKHKKFSDECMNDRAKSAREAMKGMVINNLYETQKPQWDNQTLYSNEKASNVKKPHKQLTKTLFNITQGLNGFPVVQLTDHPIEEGIDTKYISTIDNEYRWNKTTKLENNEKKQMTNIIAKDAMNNTQQHWKKTKHLRLYEDEYPISEERKKIEKLRFYKQYQDPVTLYDYNYSKMKEAKENLWFETETLAKKIRHENPGCLNIQEKINSIVQKTMYPSYKDKFDLLTGKKQEKQKVKKNYTWRDEELISKIETISNWKDINWFNSLNNKQTDPILRDEQTHKRELLKPLVVKGLELFQEENIIKIQKDNERKKIIKSAYIKQRSEALSLHDPHHQVIPSKYPLTGNVDDDNVIKPYFTEAYNDSMSINRQEQQVLTNTKDNYTHIFLDAYKKVLIDASTKDKKNKKKQNDNRKWLQYTYHHSGTYREFNDNNFDHLTNNQKGKYKAWSCCMNNIEQSQGCQKSIINKHRWNLDHF